MPMYRNDDELAAEFALELQQTTQISAQYAGEISRHAVRFFKQAAPQKSFTQVLREMNDWETDEHGSKKCPSCQQTLYWKKLSLKPRYIHALRILDRENVPLTFKQLSQFARSEPKGATYYRYFTELRHWGFVRGTGNLLDRAEQYEITPDGMRFVRGEIAAWHWVWKLKGKDLAMPQPYADTQPAPMVHAGDVLASGDTPDEDNDREGHLRNAQSVREGTVHVYGYCPVCNSPGHMRERRLNGHDTCRKGHTYPSATALEEPRALYAEHAPADRPCIADHGPHERCWECEPDDGIKGGIARADAALRNIGKNVDGITAMDPGEPEGDSTVVMQHCATCSVSWKLGEVHVCGSHLGNE